MKANPFQSSKSYYTHNNPIVNTQTIPSNTLVVVPLTLLSVIGLEAVEATGLAVTIVAGDCIVRIVDRAVSQVVFEE
jgi:hypothetical protein